MRKLMLIVLYLVLSALLFGCDSAAQPQDNIADKTSEIPVTVPEVLPAEAPTEVPDDEPDEIPSEETDEHKTGTDETDAWAWGVFPIEFTAKDLYGNLVTEETLGEKQLFFVHLWGTWCPPCVAEMPDLAVVAREFSDRVGFLGLLDDYSSNLSGAINIAESSDIPDTFIMVDARIPEMLELLSLVHTGYVPTTVIFTAGGEMFEPLIGAYGLEYSTVLNAILEG